MEKVFELILLIILALGSAVLFSFAIIWKFFVAIFHVLAGAFDKQS